MGRIFVLFLFFITNVQSQDYKTTDIEHTNDTVIRNKNQRLLALTFNLYDSGTTESSAIGKATDGKIGFNTGLQIFIYKHFFVGGFIGASYLEVKDKTLIGNYNTSTITHSYLNLGYEFPIGEKFRLGLSYTPIGRAKYKNRLSGPNRARQIDRADITMYNVSCSYNLTNTISLFIDYSYRSDTTRIITSPELQNDFNKIQYHNIGFGIRFNGGSKSLVDHSSTLFK